MDVRDFSPILETIASDYSFSRSLAIARVQKTRVFKKPNPVGFLGFWYLRVFYISMSSARCYSHQVNV